MDGGTIAILILAALILLSGSYFWIHSRAKRTDQILVPLSVQHATDAVHASFGRMWKAWEGPGHVNKKRKTAMGAVTRIARENKGLGSVVSVIIEPHHDGGTVVSVWMSGWLSQLGIPYLSGAAFRQKHKIIKYVEAAASQPQMRPTN